MSPAAAEAGRAARQLPAGCAGLIAGAALQLTQDALWPWTDYAALLAAGLLLMALRPWRPGGRWGWLAGLLVALAGLLAGFGATGWRAAAFDAQRLSPQWEGRDLLVTGVVAAMPGVNEAGTRFVLAVEQATLGGVAVALPPRILLGWYHGALGWAGAGDAPTLLRQPAALAAGERWQLPCRIKAPHGHRNPHGFDFELWLWEQGVQATGYVRAGPSDPPPRRLSTTWRHPVEGWRQRVRDRILERIADPRLAGVVAALAVGDQGAIDRADWDIYRATGVAHLMSISGLHVTVFAWAAALALGWAWRRSERLCLWLPAPQVALAGGVALAAAYALFSGWGVPAQRTVWMLALAAGLRLGARRWPWPVLLLAAGALVVLADPWALLQAGFWLSFAAVALLFASDTPSPGHGAGVALRRLLREQWVMSLGLAPLCLVLFGQVSLVGLLANLPAIPWVTGVVLPLSLLGVLLPPAWDLAAWAVAGLGGALQLLAALPGASVSLPQAPAWTGACAIAGGVLLVLRLPALLRAAAVPLCLPLLLWPQPRPAPGEFELLAADIGQGHAVLVRTERHALLYDAGPRFSRESDAGHRVLVPLLRALGERLDRVVLSHRDSDHAGGVAAVLAMQPQADFVSSIGSAHPLAALRPVQPCLAGQAWEWDGVRFELLHPQPGDLERRLAPNALSCVLRVQARAGAASPGPAALLAGDIERAQELRLAALGPAIRAELLLVPHHGSKTSSSPELLDAVAPRVAVVQAGYRNRFGHPAPQVQQRYRERGVAWFDSPHCGALTWRSARPGEVHCERERDRRYWQHEPP